MTVEPDRYREVVGHFATGVSVVTLPSDPPHGITVNAFSSVSLDPPLVLVCLDHDTRSHELLSAGAVEGYCVNVLADDGRRLGEHFARIDEFEESPFETEPTRTEATGAPVFEDALAYLDCSLDAAHAAGDHTVYVGRVAAADILRPDAGGLAYFKGGWSSIE